VDGSLVVRWLNDEPATWARALNCRLAPACVAVHPVGLFDSTPLYPQATK
jgi:hypothetical protein